MKRLFAAIKVGPSEAFLAKYYSIRKALKNEPIRWVDPGNMHITLKFFGETPEHHIPAINMALAKAAASLSPFSFSIKGTGVFGSSYRPRVIWFGIEGADEITTLAGCIFGELETIGIQRDRQNFVPHLTIARIKGLDDNKAFQEVISREQNGLLQQEDVHAFHLFESKLSPSGPEYTIIESFTLAG